MLKAVSITSTEAKLKDLVSMRKTLTFSKISSVSSSGYISQVVALKSGKPELKVLAAIGGAIDSSPWSDVAASEALRNSFAANVLTFLQENNLNRIGRKLSSFLFKL